MKKPFLLITVLGLLSLAPAARSESLTDLSRLLSTRICMKCDLIQSGLVNAHLSGAVLKGSNLRQANLSRADLSVADLSGADLRGASLAGANLAGANLEGAVLDGADLRGAYIIGAKFTDASINTPFIQGSVGLIEFNGSAETFYRWGFLEADGGSPRAALPYYNKAIATDPEYAPAYLARAIARYRIKDYIYANQDATYAKALFEKQQSVPGVEASTQLIAALDQAMNPKPERSNSVGNVIGGITSLLFRLFF